jgi:hypothetical protein
MQAMWLLDIQQARLLTMIASSVGSFRCIYLETAAFVRHMGRKTLRIIGSLRAACSEPSNGFWLAPSAHSNRRPQHAGVFRHPRALPAMPPGRLRFLMERTTF